MSDEQLDIDPALLALIAQAVKAYRAPVQAQPVEADAVATEMSLAPASSTSTPLPAPSSSANPGHSPAPPREVSPAHLERYVVAVKRC